MAPSYKGIRMRKWGRWVSEIRIPGSRTRIWLGSYDSPEKAARAYDAALYCLHGPRGRFNFPDEKRPSFSEEQRMGLTKGDIKAVAAHFASSTPFLPGNDLLPPPPSPAISAPAGAVNPSLDVDCGSPPLSLDDFLIGEPSGLGAWFYADLRG